MIGKIRISVECSQPHQFAAVGEAMPLLTVERERSFQHYLGLIEASEAHEQIAQIAEDKCCDPVNTCLLRYSERLLVIVQRGLLLPQLSVRGTEKTQCACRSRWVFGGLKERQASQGKR